MLDRVRVYFAGLARPAVVAFCLTCVFGVVALRGGYLAMSGEKKRQVTIATLTSDSAVKRGDIVDRNGELLATSVDVYSLSADPSQIWDAEEVAAKLATVFEGFDQEAAAERLGRRGKRFVWVRRGLTPRQRQSVFDLGLEGLQFSVESKRIYPRRAQSGHVLGHTNIDGVGQMGVEYAMNEALVAGTEPVQLTLDSGVQFVLEAELDEAAERYDAIGGIGIVLEVSSGKLRGLASWPAFNPNVYSDASDTERFNRAVSGVYELGSIFKPLTVAAAFEAGVLTEAERFDVRKPIVLRGKSISDTHKAGAYMNAATVLAESSNIGTVKIAQKLGETGLVEAFEAFGLLGRAHLEIPGSAKPILPPEWTDQALATSSYGHGIAISPLAFAGAFAALGNGGMYTEISVVESDEVPNSRQIMSPKTAATVTGMLRNAVLNGTGKSANVAGYQVAGKTGTAEKPIDGVYQEDRNITSFAALFPASRPEFVVLIVLDDPKRLAGDGGATAAWNAAPAVGRIIERIAPILGVAPQFDQAALDDATQRSVP